MTTRLGTDLDRCTVTRVSCHSALVSSLSKQWSSVPTPGRCAITGNKVQPVLQAAHIRPLPQGGEHRIDNGLLLKSDVHILFDRGYLGVDPKYRLMVSPRLRSEFGNGDQFYAKAGMPIAVPERRHDRPNAEFLEWHLETVFKAA
jgi:putative restriction endonuclease